MNLKNIFINVCLLMLFLVSCEAEKDNNNNENNEEETVVEQFDNSIPVSHYLEKRKKDSDVGYLPVESWNYNSKGELSEYCMYTCNNPDEIEVKIYDNDTADKKQIGRQTLEYRINSITNARELFQKEIFDINGKQQYKSIKTINGNEIVYVEKKNNEVSESKKYIYNDKGLLIKEYAYGDEEQTDCMENIFYEYIVENKENKENKVDTVITRNYHDIDNDETDDVVKTYYTKYSYNIAGGKTYRKETFLLKEEGNNIISGTNVTDDLIADSCEVKEYELDDSDNVIKEHTISDGKDQNYTVYSYAEYDGKKYKGNIHFYNNAENDNQLIGRQEYRYYDDNDSDDYFYEEIFYSDSESSDYDEDYTYISRSGNRILEGCRTGVNSFLM